MATFNEIKAFIENIADNYGTFYSTNAREFANLTQKTNTSTVLILLDSPLITSENTYTEGGRVVRGYSLPFFILKFVDTEFTEDQIDDIYSDMEEIASQFFWALNVGNTTLFQIDRMVTERVKWITP
ncbi:unnamed protein product, partial [marine sediment metagenome]